MSAYVIKGASLPQGELGDVLIENEKIVEIGSAISSPIAQTAKIIDCLLYTSPSPRD